MPTWSHRRQLLFLLIPLFFTFAVSSVFYAKYVYTSPTCFDKIQNGGETGVDCGGSCSLLCTGDALSPVVLWAKSFRVTSNVYNAVAYIENPNLKSEAKNIPYEFRLYDSNNQLIDSRKGSVDIPRNKKFAIFESGFQVSGKPVKRTEFDLQDNINWIKNQTVEPDLQISHQPIESASTTPKIQGVIYNPNTKDVGQIELVALVLDGRQNAVGVSRTVVDPIKGGDSAPFVFTWPQPFETGVDVCEVPSKVMLVLDRSGSMASISKEPPEPLTSVKNTASAFISQLKYGDSVGVISFATKNSNPIDQPLTTNFDQTKTAIQSIIISTSTADQNTNIGDALYAAVNELNGVVYIDGGETKKIIILLTDGEPTDPQQKGIQNYPTLYAQKAAEDARAKGINIYAIGLGNQVNKDLLEQVAGLPERFFFAPNTETLSSIYKKIASSICVRKPNVIEIISRVLSN